MLGLKAIAALALAPLVACGGRETAFVALPELPTDIQSWVLARVDGSGEVEATAADRAHPVIEFAVNEDAVELELRGYRDPLAEHRLEPGRVPRGGAGVGQATGLPEADLALRTTIDGATAGAWALGEIEAVKRFQRAIDTPCVKMRGTIHELPAKGNVVWAASVDASTALAGASDDTVVAIHENGQAQVIQVVPANPGLRSVFVDRAGDLWLGTQRGGVWRGRYADGRLSIEPIVRTSSVGPIHTITGDASAPASQLYVMSTAGVVARVEDGVMRPLDRLPDAADIGDFAVTLLYLGDDTLLYGRSSASFVRRYTPDGIEDVTLHDEAAGVLILRRFEDGSIVAGLTAGAMARFEDERWAPIRPPLTLDIRALHPFEGGFLYAGSFGYVGQWHRAVGFCEVTEPPVAGNTVKHILPLGDRLLMMGNERRNSGFTPFALIELW